ncbi:MAG: aspartate dehydrogenase [Lachnospiraceae bacterium]|nr:aspartate dehydrogenase [Lachnospiraceae bacterium]
MFGKFSKKSSPKALLSWDPSREEPVVKKSICTGEATVGFVDRATGKYRDVRKVTTQMEIEAFCREAGIEPGSIKTIY